MGWDTFFVFVFRPDEGTASAYGVSIHQGHVSAPFFLSCITVQTPPDSDRV